MTQVLDAAASVRLLPYAQLLPAVSAAVRAYADGGIRCPERHVVPLGESGVMLSMVAAAKDIAIHKLVNVCPENRAHGLPTIHGVVTAYDTHTGQALFVLDGPTVTARRTAAVTLLGVAALGPSVPLQFLLIGTGTQAAQHARAIAEVYPKAGILVRGRNPSRARQFSEEHSTPTHPILALADGAIPAEVDVVITLTTSATPVYAEAPTTGRLVIATGAFTASMAEVAALTVSGSEVYVDDLANAHGEAGDILNSGVDWSRVGSLSDALAKPARRMRPMFFKTVGCAAWDLAACRVARQELGA